MDNRPPSSPSSSRSSSSASVRPPVEPPAGPMLVVHVSVRVVPGTVEDFLAATIENARASLREPGVARFDVVQEVDDPTSFVLVEAYRTVDGASAHKETAHYQKWRDTVAPLMAEPRTSVKYVNIHPEAEDW